MCARLLLAYGTAHVLMLCAACNVCMCGLVCMRLQSNAVSGHQRSRLNVTKAAVSASSGEETQEAFFLDSLCSHQHLFHWLQAAQPP